MTNIEIRDFATVQGVSDTDFVVLSLYGGSSAKMAVGLFSSNMKADTKPAIKDGIWWIGSTNTEVQAEGKSPEFRKSQLGIEWKYTVEDDAAWKLLVGIEEIRFRFDELTDEQRESIALKFSDLTEEEIAELQKPANDMIAKLEETDRKVGEAEEARVEEFAKLKTESEKATAAAKDTADHPTYVGDDNYVYKWNSVAGTYDRTSVYVRGEAFSISKVYVSIDEMLADRTTQFKEGDFCMINTGDVENPDNAKLYVRTAVGGWDFVVDMSGAIGFTGKTPQMFIGTVSVGSGKASAAVTLTSGGVDSDGNPKYNINYVIPCLAYEDLTEAQIAELQRPASDMIARLEATDNSVKEAEAVRVSAEETRISNEKARTSAEDVRKDAENVRLSSESTRVANENVRLSSEDARRSAENERKTAETERAAAEEARKQAEQERVATDDERKLDYEALKADLVANSQIMLVSESEYEDAVDSGKIDETKLYFAYEE